MSSHLGHNFWFYTKIFYIFIKLIEFFQFYTKYANLTNSNLFYIRNTIFLVKLICFDLKNYLHLIIVHIVAEEVLLLV